MIINENTKEKENLAVERERKMCEAQKAILSSMNNGYSFIVILSSMLHTKNLDMKYF